MGCVLRAGRAAPRSRVPVPPSDQPHGWPPGHFTALMREHDWPPGFAPQYRRTREVEQSKTSRIGRERRQALGETGTIVGLSGRADRLIQQRLVPPPPAGRSRAGVPPGGADAA